MCRQRRVLGILGVQRAWWKLPRSVLGVLRVWRLANGRLECPNKRGLCAGKGQAAMLERWRPGAWWKLPRGMDGQRAWWKLPRGMRRQRAGCNPGAAKADGQRACWKLPRSVLGVLRVWRLANGRLECRNKRGLCAGIKGRLQCWSADGQELGGSCCEGCAGKGQAATLEQQRLTAKSLVEAKADGQRPWWKLPWRKIPHLRWSQAPPRPWRRPGPADMFWFLLVHGLQKWCGGDFRGFWLLEVIHLQPSSCMLSVSTFLQIQTTVCGQMMALWWFYLYNTVSNITVIQVQVLKDDSYLYVPVLLVSELGLKHQPSTESSNQRSYKHVLLGPFLLVYESIYLYYNIYIYKINIYIYKINIYIYI